MISEKQYYKKFYNIFIKKNKLLFDESLIKDYSLSIVEPKSAEYKNLQFLLSNIEKKYKFDMHLNYKQLYMWQKAIMFKIDNERMLAAGKLVLFCCLVDNFLDSPRFSKLEKDRICEKAGKIFFDNIYDDKTNFIELDILAKDVLNFYNNHPIDSMCCEWKEDLFKAFQSEEYMYRSNLNKYEKIPDEDLSILIDKSTLFEKVVFLTATYGYNTIQSVEAAELLGEMFWLVDDLCDFVEDVHAGRKNSLLFYCIKERKELTLERRIELVYNNMDFAVDHLNNVLAKLKKLVDNEMFFFIVLQIWKWCHNIRKIAE